jgi:hypothetical protein
VVLNPKVKAEIKAPSKGKFQKEYDETVKKMEEFREMNQGRR